MYPTEYRYTEDHEWLRVEGDEATVGITDYAQKELGDIVYLEFPGAQHVFDLFYSYRCARMIEGATAFLNDERSGRGQP